jgi:hypothetical protein
MQKGRGKREEGRGKKCNFRYNLPHNAERAYIHNYIERNY